MQRLLFPACALLLAVPADATPRHAPKPRINMDQARRIHEIGVDANSGRIVENAFEDPRKSG